MASVSYRARFWWDHRWTAERLSDYLDGDLGASARARARRHVGECAECRQVLAGLRVVVEALHGLSAPSGHSRARQTSAAIRRRLSQRAAD